MTEEADPRTPDEELFASIARGDEGAFAALVARYSPRLRAYIGRRVAINEVEDLLQETWFFFFRHFLRIFKPKPPLFPEILFALARHTITDFHRAGRLAPGRLANREVSDTPTALEQLIQHEESLLLSDAIERSLLYLAQDERQIIELNLKGHALSEIGSILHRSPSSVWRIWSRAIANIRRNLAPYYEPDLDTWTLLRLAHIPHGSLSFDTLLQPSKNLAAIVRSATTSVSTPKTLDDDILQLYEELRQLSGDAFQECLARLRSLQQRQADAMAAFFLRKSPIDFSAMQETIEQANQLIKRHKRPPPE